MQSQLTPKQQQFLDYFQSELMNSGQAPSLRRAATDLGVSHAAIAQIIKALEEKGCVKREGRYSRTVHPPNSGPAAVARSSDYRARHSRSADVCPNGVGRNHGA